MAAGRVRMHVAARATGAAVVALLVGPGVTWGLDIPAIGGSGETAGQLAATAQGVATTAEQATRSTVSIVEPAVPMTVVPEAAPNPVQRTVAAVSAPPVQPAPRRTASVQKQTTAAPIRKTPVMRISEETRLALRTPQPAGGSLREAARTLTPTAKARRPPAAPEPAPQCDGFPALVAFLPGGIDVRAVLAIVCNARNLVAPARIGDPRIAGAGVSIGDVLGAAAAGGAQAYARLAGLDRQSRAVPGRALPTTAAGHRGNSVAGAGRTELISPNGLAFPSAVLPQADTVSSRAPTAKATRHGHGGSFTTPVTGTGVLSAVLLLDVALLAAIVLWRMARRWLVPRFA